MNSKGGHAILRSCAFTSSTTWTVPRDGKYLITCIGHGGNGYAANVSARTPGGGSGAIAQSLLELTKDSQYDITVDTTTSSFSTLLSAGAGQTPTNYSTSTLSGAGGIAQGGNILNLNGNGGYANADAHWNIGASTPLTTPNAINTTQNANYAGGEGYNPINTISYGGPTSTVVFTSASSSAGEPGAFGGGSSGNVNSNRSGGATGIRPGGGNGFGAGGAGSAAAQSYFLTTGGQGGLGLVYIEYFDDIFDE